jgi:hypothetical protein
MRSENLPPAASLTQINNSGSVRPLATGRDLKSIV